MRRSQHRDKDRNRNRDDGAHPKKSFHVALSIPRGDSTLTFTQAKRLNIIIGRNGAGKSQLLHGIHTYSDPARRRVAESSQDIRAAALKSLNNLPDTRCAVGDAYESFEAITGMDLDVEEHWDPRTGNLLASSGHSRLLYILLSICAGKGGVVLFDELDNGIGPDWHVRLIREMLRLATKHNAQVFFSTLDKELLKAFGIVGLDHPTEMHCMCLTDDGTAITEFNMKMLQERLDNRQSLV